jgi:hypothetical protein
MYTNQRPIYKIKPSVRFKNNITNEVTRGDIVNEEFIDGKQFYVVKVGPRLLKFSKEGYTLLKTSN